MPAGGKGRPLTNFGWILDGQLAGSDMVFPEDGRRLLEEGVRSLISLTERNPASRGELPPEVLHLHLPVPDMTAPSEETIRRAVGFIDESLAARRPVAVHCGAGYGRTGSILACYLVHRGLAPDTAIQEVRARRPGSIETPEQEAAIHRFAASRSPDRVEER